MVPVARAYSPRSRTKIPLNEYPSLAQPLGSHGSTRIPLLTRWLVAAAAMLPAVVSSDVLPVAISSWLSPARMTPWL